MKKLILSLLVAVMISFTLPNTDTKNYQDTSTYEQAPIKVLGW